MVVIGAYCKVCTGSVGKALFTLNASYKSTEVQHVTRLNKRLVSSLFWVYSLAKKTGRFPHGMCSVEREKFIAQDQTL